MRLHRIVRLRTPCVDSSLRSRPVVGAILNRAFSSHVSTTCNVITAKVSHGLNEPIDVHVTYPPRPETSGPLILALGNEHNYLGQHVLQTLAASSNAIVVHPTYHFANNRRYPASIHINLAVFDWMWHNMQENEQAAADEDLRRIGVCGDLLAGSLAISLALTECRPFHPHVSAVAVTDPVLDWTDVFPLERPMTMEDITSASQTEAESIGSCRSDDAYRCNMDQMLWKRRQIFNKAEAFFDPFASPLLFFRTPHFDLPPPPNPLLQEINQEDPHHEDGSAIQRKRTYPRVFPPYKSPSVLPPVKIVTGADFVLRHQSSEILSNIRKSHERAARASSGLSDTELDRRLVSEHVSSVGAWDHGPAAKIGEWLGATLRE